MKKEYYYQNIDDIIKLFKSNTVSGLTSKEVVEKTKIYGQNVIPSKNTKPTRINNIPSVSQVAATCILFKT